MTSSPSNPFDHWPTPAELESWCEFLYVVGADPMVIARDGITAALRKADDA